MAPYLRCNKCGYDLYGHEFLANMIDPSLIGLTNAYYPDSALLAMTTRSLGAFTCPNCQSTGDFSS